MEVTAFLDRVFARLPAGSASSFKFEHWSYGNKPTSEGVGVLPVAGADPDRIIARVMDVNRYVGNVEHVEECRAIQDSRFVPPGAVRFYQRVNVPMLSRIHHELVLVDGGTRDGWRFAYWYMLEPETRALSTRDAARSGYNDGAWLVKPGLVAYALSSAPMREDVGFLKWKALTAGADVAAGAVVKANVDGMARWAARG